MGYLIQKFAVGFPYPPMAELTHNASNAILQSNTFQAYASIPGSSYNDFKGPFIQGSTNSILKVHVDGTVYFKSYYLTFNPIGVVRIFADGTLKATLDTASPNGHTSDGGPAIYTSFAVTQGQEITVTVNGTSKEIFVMYGSSTSEFNYDVNPTVYPGYP